MKLRGKGRELYRSDTLVRASIALRGALPHDEAFTRDILIMTMPYRRLGDSGLEVSVLCLGTMMFGDRTDAATAQRIIDSAFDAGVNFIDTADAGSWRPRSATP